MDDPLHIGLCKYFRNAWIVELFRLELWNGSVESVRLTWSFYFLLLSSVFNLIISGQSLSNSLPSDVSDCDETLSTNIYIEDAPISSIMTLDTSHR